MGLAQITGFFNIRDEVIGFGCISTSPSIFIQLLNEEDYGSLFLAVNDVEHYEDRWSSEVRDVHGFRYCRKMKFSRSHTWILTLLLIGSLLNESKVGYVFCKIPAQTQEIWDKSPKICFAYCVERYWKVTWVIEPPRNGKLDYF